MQPTNTASFTPDELQLVLYKAEDGTVYRVVLKEPGKFQAAYERLTKDLPERAMVAVDRNGRAFRLGSFDGNGVDGNVDREPPGAA